MSGIFGSFRIERYDGEERYVSIRVYQGLYALQHRGQVATGIVSIDGQKLKKTAGDGLISSLYTRSQLENAGGINALGHVKYAFENEIDDGSFMPYTYGGGATLAVEGVFLDKDIHPDNIFEAIKEGDSSIVDFLNKTDGAYAFVYMDSKKLVIARDSNGIKNIIRGKLDRDYIVSSESCALDVMDVKEQIAIKPGEVFIVDDSGERSYFLDNRKSKSCIFEKIYISRPDSYIEGISVYESRYNLGQILYSECPTEADIVIGAPDSGTIAALGYANKSGIKYIEGIVKNRYIDRTFIESRQEERENTVSIKLNPIKRNIEGKDIILVDDSVVRGTTMKRTIDILKKAGVKKIHVRVAAPAVKYSCNMSIDTPKEKYLINSERTTEEVRKIIGADSLYYISIKGLKEACRSKNHCMACFDGHYPLIRRK